MSKAVVIIVGIIMSLGLLLIGFFISYDQINEHKKTVVFPTKTVTKIENNAIPLEIKEERLESLPNAEEEAARWNGTATEFIAMYNEFKYNPTDIIKEETKSNDEITTFTHGFKTTVKISLVYTVNNETKEITEMKLICFDTGPDRAAIFHSMSMFISFVDSDTSITQAGNYLGEIPFSTNEEGLYEVQFNGKSYEFIVDDKEGTNTLVYRIVE